MPAPAPLHTLTLHVAATHAGPGSLVLSDAHGRVLLQRDYERWDEPACLLSALREAGARVVEDGALTCCATTRCREQRDQDSYLRSERGDR